MKKTEINAVREIVRTAYNVRLFERCGYGATACAQKNLDGITHYVDASTLRYFHVRIVGNYVSESGLVFGMIESTARDPNNSSRGFRFVAFDVFGTVLERANLENLVSTSAKAEKDYYAWLNNFDTAAHYKKVMAADIDKAKRSIKTLAESARKIKV